MFVGSGVLLMRLQNLFIGRPNPFLQWAACKKRPLCLVIFGSCTTFVWRKPSPDALGVQNPEKSLRGLEQNGMVVAAPLPLEGAHIPG